MTDREAIARFEPYIGNECYRKEFQEACAHAISAIKEREERSKGCEFCGAKLYFKTTQYARPLLAPLTEVQALRDKLTLVSAPCAASAGRIRSENFSSLRRKPGGDD